MPQPRHLTLPIVLALLAALGGAGPATAPARDDAAYLQQLLGRGGSVTIPPGHYVTGRPIVLENVSALTVSAYRVTIQADPKQPRTVGAGDTLRLVRCKQVSFLGLGLDGNRAARGGFRGDPQLLHLVSCDDVTVRDCSFAAAVCDELFAWGGFNPATADAACHRLSVENCRFRDPGRNCVSLVGVACSKVTGCDFAGAVTSDPMMGVDVEANAGDPEGINHDLLIQGNRARDVHIAFGVIKTASPRGVVICGNSIDQTTGDAIFNEGTDTVVAANAVTRCGAAAVSSCNGGTARIWANGPGAVYAEGGNVVEGVPR